MNRLLFNGAYSSDYGIFISGEGTYNAPELDVDVLSVPGRSGDLVFSNKRYKNITVKYPAYIPDDFKANSSAAKSWLMTPQKYCRLQDDYHPDEYRMALFTGPLDFSMQQYNRSGAFELSFNCKPQRYLVEGEQKITLSNGASVYNPTAFPALPLIEVTGTGAGTLTVGDYAVQILSLSHLIIDSEIQDAYFGSVNLNSTVSIPSFPVLEAGRTIISWTGAISSVSIQPGWWTL